MPALISNQICAFIAHRSLVRELYAPRRMRTEQTRRRRAVHGPQPGHHCFADKFALLRERFHQQYALALLVWFTAAGFGYLAANFIYPAACLMLLFVQFFMFVASCNAWRLESQGSFHAVQSNFFSSHVHK